VRENRGTLNEQSPKVDNSTRTSAANAWSIIAEQKLRAAGDLKARAAAAPTATTAATPPANTQVPATVANDSTAVAIPDNRTVRQKYLDDVAPASIVGRLVRFGKEGTFITVDDGALVPETAEFVVPCDETQVGWVKFNGEGVPPDRVMGLLYDGFVPPPRNTLGDLDEDQWGTGLDGRPDDPWKHQMNLVLQNTETKELFTFSTMSVTGRRAVGNLLKHYDRMQKLTPTELPVVRLRAGGYNHRDDRVGWVAVPVFVVIGRAPRGSAAVPDTSIGNDMGDSIPF
jgi:hypothetical protein